MFATKTPPAITRPRGTSRHRPWSDRRGAVLLITVIFLFVATSITVGIARAMAHEHRQMRQRQRQLQAVWLAESGIERAAAQLRLDPQYEGETWTLAAEMIVSDVTGAVQIQSKPVDGQPQRRSILVVADYPPDSPHRIRHRKTVIIDVPSLGDPS